MSPGNQILALTAKKAIPKSEPIAKGNIFVFDTCIFKKNNRIFFLNEYNDKEMAVLNGNNIWIKKWNISASVVLDKNIIMFENNTKWERVKITKIQCFLFAFPQNESFLDVKKL